MNKKSATEVNHDGCIESSGLDDNCNIIQAMEHELPAIINGVLEDDDIVPFGWNWFIKNIFNYS